MTMTLDGTSGLTTPGVVNTAGETIATTLAVTGASTLTGAVTASTTLAVTGASTLTGQVTATNGMAVAAGLATGTGIGASGVGGDLRLYANGIQSATITAAGLFQFNSGYGSVATAYGCRAWVNFNGTGTVAIRASGNVSSITDNGTGDYTVNFTTAMVDVNYSTVGLCGGTGDAFSAIGSTYTTSAVRVKTRTALDAASDPATYCVAVFR
jgi:hypothetical protein